MKKLMGAVAGLAIAAGSAGAQNIVLNPGFESLDGLAPWVTTGFPLWTRFYYDTHTGQLAASTGCVGAACVNPPAPSSLFQDLVTTPGQSYNLSYWFHDNGVPFQLSVFWGGNLVQDFTSPSSLVYNQFFVNTLVASGTTTRLEFWGRQDTGFNRLDDVSVVAVASNVVPEPASLTLLATGLAGVFGAAQRKRRAQLTD